MPVLDLFWTMLWFFIFFAWLMLLFRVFGDIFRGDMSGVSKAIWSIFVIVVPFLGTLVYLIVHGSDMQQRAMEQATASAQAQQAYIREAAGSGASPADELEKLSRLHQQGVLTDAEFQVQKAKALA